MNYLILLTEVLLINFVIILFYKINKKDGLYLCMALFGIMLSVAVSKTIDILSFNINFGFTITIGIIILNNIIIHKYGSDETKKIILTLAFSYIITFILMMITTFMTSSNHNLISNNTYDLLFGSSLYNIRLFIAGLISTIIMLYFDSNIYYYIRKNKNSIIFNNIGSILIILLIESIIFVTISEIGNYSFVALFGMIVIRYLVEVLIGLICILPIYLLVKGKIGG